MIAGINNYQALDEIMIFYYRCIYMSNPKNQIMFIKRFNFSFKVFSFLMLMSVLFMSLAGAQQLPMQQPAEVPEYTDDELLVFINAAQKIMPLQQESQMKMIEKIEEEDLTVEKFNDIMESFSNGQNGGVQQTEMESFNNAMEGIQDIQAEYEDLMAETIIDEGMSAAKYEEIVSNYQRDPELQMRINILLEEMEEDRQ